MPTTFRPYEPDQMLLMPPALQDWLSEGHLAHHVSDLVDGLDLGVFYAPYEGDGRGSLWDLVDRRDEGSGERVQAQGDELQADGCRGEAP